MTSGEREADQQSDEEERTSPPAPTLVIPAQAVIQYGSAVRLVLWPIVAGYWIPAFAGMTALEERGTRKDHRFIARSMRWSGISHIIATSA
jgi:hypothetical protein